ncbi:MAG: hypothetical protein VKK42_23555 [Lyngbya sp.]|nr:hypothetical protein [Lyngbya sp.]
MTYSTQAKDRTILSFDIQATLKEDEVIAWQLEALLSLAITPQENYYRLARNSFRWGLFRRNTPSPQTELGVFLIVIELGDNKQTLF